MFKASPENDLAAFSAASGPQTLPASSGISLSEIISALSFAIDLTEGAVPGHALRSCILGMRIARHAGIPDTQLDALYYALLLKDVGCSSNAARMCQIVGGDDRAVKNLAKLQDWTRRRPTRDTVKLLWKQVLPSATPIRRLARLARMSADQGKNNAEMIALRCDRGANIVRKLGFSATTSEAIHALDEHWDGSGYPGRLRRDAIPLLARILAVAQHLDVFASEGGPAVAMLVLRERSRRWFDPELVRVVSDLDRQGKLWSCCLPSTDQNLIRQLVIDIEPRVSVNLGHQEIDGICEAFADVVDAKSPFTFRHSVGVANVSTAMAKTMRLPPDRVQLVRRAALLHDLGKLAVSNTILDKPGRLTPDEWAAVAEHPRLTQQILARVQPFNEMARIAGAHHEKLDGSGYPDRLQAHQLGTEARIIAVADMYQALTEDRPYRSGFSHLQTMSILLRDVPGRLDAACVEALDQIYKPVQADLPLPVPHWPLPPGSAAGHIAM